MDGQKTLFDVPPRPTIQERFERYHRANPAVYDLFKRFAFELADAGRTRYSADAILHRVRWHYATCRVEGEEFKANNDYSSRYARMLMAEHPEVFAGFFETRALDTP